jgi:hypothetical protein
MIFLAQLDPITNAERDCMIANPNQTTMVIQSLRVAGKLVPVVAVNGEFEHLIIIDFFIGDHGVDSRAADRERAWFQICECGDAEQIFDAKRDLTRIKLEEIAPKCVYSFDKGAAIECIGDVERAFAIVVIHRWEHEREWLKSEGRRNIHAFRDQECDYRVLARLDTIVQRSTSRSLCIRSSDMVTMNNTHPRLDRARFDDALLSIVESSSR